MNLNNIYNQEQFIARNAQERRHVKDQQARESHPRKPMLPAIKHLFGRRGAPMKQEEQAR